MNTLCIVQARMGSTRLPRKGAAAIDGRSMTTHVLRRAGLIRGVDLVILAAPPGIENEELRVDAEMAGAIFWQPQIDEANVLSRYMNAAYVYDAQIVMRLTGDCPLLDPQVSSRVLEQFTQHGAEYASNTHPGVDGLDTEVFTRQALEVAHEQARTPDQREHVTLFMREEMVGDHLHIGAYVEHSGLKLSVDTAVDLAVVRAIYARLERTTEAYPYKTDFKATLAAIEQRRREGVFSQTLSELS